MKQVFFAGALAAALTLTVLSQQRVAAQDCQRGGNVTFTTGVTFGLHWTPKHGHWVPDPCGPVCGGPYGYPPPLPYPPPGYPGARLPPPPAAPPAPPGPPPGPPSAATSTAAAGVQNVGYTYPAAYGYDYAYGYSYPLFQAPAYWYGR